MTEPINGDSASDSAEPDEKIPYIPPSSLRYRSPILNGATGLLEETIIAAPSSVELHRTPTTDYLSRFLSATPHIAELFHCNSRIAACSDANTVLDRKALGVAHDWFYDTAFKPDDDVYDREAAVQAGVLGAGEEISAPAVAALRWIASDDAPEICYALDLLVIDDSRVWRVLAGAPETWLERTLSSDESRALVTALPELDLDLDRGLPPLIFVAGAPWRYMMLQGPRGYRRTLIDAGRLIGALVDHGRLGGSAVSVSVDFVDIEVDRLLRLDGVERSVLAVVSFDVDEKEEEIPDD